MPKDPRIKKVLVIGSGPIIIGQAAEFDYSGTQACRALKSEGVETVLVNSNPATIMTDPDIADHVYISFQESDEPGTVVHISVDGVYAGQILIADRVKPGAAQAIAQLRSAGVRRMVMLTGDHRSVAEKVAKELGIDEYYSELLPADKVTKVEELLAERSNDRDKLAFVGDGINDAPVLSRADIGIAMGAMGSDAAIEAADVVLMDDDPRKIAKAIKISRKCLRIVYQNTWFAIGVKLGCLLLGALGIANMWLAIFADVGVMVLAVLNAIRALFVKNL